MVYPLDSVPNPNPKTNPLIHHNVRWGDMKYLLISAELSGYSVKRYGGRLDTWCFACFSSVSRRISPQESRVRVARYSAVISQAAMLPFTFKF